METEEIRYRLTRDETENGRRVERVILDNVSHDECLIWIHRHTPFSFDEATRHQGYRVIRKMTRAEEQQAYEMRESRDHADFIGELEHESLADRRKGRADWLEAMAEHRDTIAERLVWLFQGSYGKGALMEAERIARNTRQNREAAIGQLLAAVEWQCAPSEARKAWAKLSAEDQRAVTEVLRAGIAEYLETAEGLQDG